MSEKSLTLEAQYQTWGALRRDLRQQIAMGGLLLRIAGVEAPQFSPLTVRLVRPDGESHELPGQVLQMIAGHGVAVGLGAEARPEIDRLAAACEASQAGDGEEPGADDPVVSTGEVQRRSARLQLATDPVELRAQLEGMTVNEKRAAALVGRREVRMLLIRDINKAVHPFVIKNPAITLEEVEAFSKMPSINPDALRMMAANRDWTRSAGVVRNLVRNPKTPLTDALALLDKLPINELRALAKSSAVRAPIQQAARKRINE